MTWWWRPGLTVPALFLVHPLAAQVDPQRAETYFKEAAAICQRDGGRLWGVSLCGPMVFADARTHTLATNQPAPAGEWPRNLGFANAPMDWAGERWSAYVWDFTVALGDDRVRGILMLHELFHRIQPDLGLLTQGGNNAHLDTVEGRVWLRLEWRALARALEQSGEARKHSVSDALGFRQARRSQFANAAENERVEEIREGLAQYTGTVATAGSSAEAVASGLAQLTAAEGHETFLQQAYVTGLGYAMLLDDASPDWRRRVRSDSDLGQMLMEALGAGPTTDATAAAAGYGAADLRAAEARRDEQRRALVSQLRDRFVDGPGLLVPAGGSGSFNAVGATPIPGVGPLVQPYRHRGAWGTLEATKGVLVNDDGTRRLPGPVRIDGTTLTGDGWAVTVAPGWTVRSGPRPGDYQIVREPEERPRGRRFPETAEAPNGGPVLTHQLERPRA